ncbi:carboxypeptidase regulatory-like domain-containing protein [bacterium]|nr:carboxypeptidase regulatory-like domain-containing protein [bacterium]
MKTRFTVAAVLLTISFGAFAGTLKGTVTDENDSPMAGVDVSVWGKESIKSKTDARGQFKITSDELVPGNRYSVKAEKEGYIMSQASFGTEMYEEEEDMEPLEITMKKEDPEPEAPATEVKDPALKGGTPAASAESESESEEEAVKEEEAKSAEKAEAKPAEKEEAKPAEKPAEKTEAKPAEKEEAKPAEKPAEK